MTLPGGFLLGSATSAHQVEGGNVGSDWWEWEHARADRAKSLDACDHYHRYSEDVALMRALGLNAFRFSIEWARIEPEEGFFSRAVLAHYGEVIDACRANGIEPVVTLVHQTLPRWFAKRGGWLWEAAPASLRVVLPVCRARPWGPSGLGHDHQRARHRLGHLIPVRSDASGDQRSGDTLSRPGRARGVLPRRAKRAPAGRSRGAGGLGARVTGVGGTPGRRATARRRRCTRASSGGAGWR